MGGLTFHPPSDPEPALAQSIELGELAAHARQVYDDAVEDVLPALVRAGVPSGGARPKALVGLPRHGPGVMPGEGELPAGWEAWLVKFQTSQDDRDVARREWAYNVLAARAGIEVAEVRVFELGTEQAFGTRRFDRPEGGRRLHLLSAAGALGVDFRTAYADYQSLLQLALLFAGGDQRPVLELFRRAVFNAVFRNDDDHLKNHAWLLSPDGWRLAPAYDLTFAPARYRAVPILGADGDVTRRDFEKLARAVGLKQALVGEVLDAVLEAAGALDGLLAEHGCDSAVSRAAVAAVEARRAALR